MQCVAPNKLGRYVTAGAPLQGVGGGHLCEAHGGAHALAAAGPIPHLDLAIQASRQQQVARLGKEPAPPCRQG